MASQPNDGTDNSESTRYQRGIQAYASQFHIPPDQVPAWFSDAVGDRFAEEAMLAIYSGFARASHGLMIIRDELSKPPRPVLAGPDHICPGN